MGQQITIKDTYISKHSNPTNVYSNYQIGCKAPTAIIHKGNHARWLFTNLPSEIGNADQVIYGRTPDEMMEALERYLDIPRHSDHIEFIEMVKGSQGPAFLHVLDYPKFKPVLKRPEDILNHLDLVSKFGSIRFNISREAKNLYYDSDVRASLERILEPKGYVIDGYFIVKKNKRLALQRKKYREKVNKTYTICDLERTLREVEKVTNLGPGVKVTSNTQSCINYMRQLFVYLSLIERVHGKNSYRRLAPFQKMLAKWKASEIYTKPFHTEECKPYKEWLDKQAAKRKSRATSIRSVKLLDCIVEESK